MVFLFPVSGNNRGMDALLFERCLVSLVAEKAIEKYGTHADFAKIAFAGTAAPLNVWRAIRNGQKGKPREVSLRDAVQMADAIGMDLEVLCWQVARKLADGWASDDDVCLKPSPRGRPQRQDGPQEGALPTERTQI